MLLLLALALLWPADKAPTAAATMAAVPASRPDTDDRLGKVEVALARTLATPVPTPPPAPSAAPMQLLISAMDLHPKVESVGVDPTGAMDVPGNVWDVGWYNLGPVPGDPGDAVIDGHAGYPGAPLVFARLAKLQAGDRMVVVLADGSRRAFIVESITSWPAASHPTGLFEPDGPPRLSLITCTGDFNPKTST
ncbi:MAG: class F sortase, partial [Chloroflexota bacterium]